MKLRTFMRRSGFKVLAMARLTECEYSIVFYLLNCVASGLERIITREDEMASLIGYREERLRQALTNLIERQIVCAKGFDPYDPHAVLSLRLELDIKRWKLNYDSNATAEDAIVYPFIRDRKAGLELVHTEARRRREEDEDPPEGTWQRVLETFERYVTLSDEEREGATQSAKTLATTHHVDQVLLLLHHFEDRIKSLSLLASSWQPFFDLYHQESQRVDFYDAKLKHQHLDEELKQKSLAWLEDREDRRLTADEVNVLNLFVRHKQPRRQLFWAYQLRSRYKNLADFFEETMEIMIPVTTSGAIVSRKPSKD